MRSRGFSLLELVVVVAVLGLLAALVAPAAKNLILESKAQHIVDVADKLRAACHRYWIDTGLPAVESAIGSPSGIAIGGFAAPTRNELFHSSGIRGWNGPYLEAPLTILDLGLEATSGAFVYDTLNISGGFKLQGAAGPALSGVGNCLVLTEIELELGKAIDELLDKTVAEADRPIFGRVTYAMTTPPSKATVFILLLASP